MSKNKKEEYIDKMPYNKQGEKHGYWEKYWHKDSLWYITNYVNGVRYGYFFFDWHGREDREYYAR
jgi:hypothetical protein